jgi:hypothetical protein
MKKINMIGETRIWITGSVKSLRLKKESYQTQPPETLYGLKRISFPLQQAMAFNLKRMRVLWLAGTGPPFAAQS